MSTTKEVTSQLGTIMHSPATALIIILGFFGTGFLWLMNQYGFHFSLLLSKFGLDGIIVLSISISVFIATVSYLSFTIWALILGSNFDADGIFAMATLFSTFFLLTISEIPFQPFTGNSGLKVILFIIAGLIIFIPIIEKATEKKD